MLENGRRLGNIAGVPRCTFGRVSDCFEKLRDEGALEGLPVWNGELYFELHRGCQTSQARNKANNRRAEWLMREVELWSVLAYLQGARYPRTEIQDCWKQLLTCQFHDILPGTSINEVYEWTDTVYGELFKKAETLRQKALAYLAQKIALKEKDTSLLVFNSLGWYRSGICEYHGKLPKGDFCVVNEDNEPVPFQRIGHDRLLFEVRDVPPLGYSVYRLVVGYRAGGNGGESVRADVRFMENESIRLEFGPRGTLTRIVDKRYHREVLPEGSEANELQFFEDLPHVWEAWDIDFNFESKKRVIKELDSIEVIENGPLRSVVRLSYTYGKSTIVQDVMLYAGSSRIDFVTRVDWHEKRTLLKAAFPVDIRSSYATYEVQFGTIERPTHRNRDFDAAQFEVPAQKWADLSEGNYGVSLLNDSKYGYDVKDNVMRLSLLRSPVDPDPLADQGEHQFTYALLPHVNDWREETVKEAYELNIPFTVVPVSHATGDMDSEGFFASTDAENVILETVKLAEDSNEVVLRLFEAYGERKHVAIEFGFPVKQVWECDLMEENDKPVSCKDNTVELFISPYEIRTLKIALK